MGTFNLREKKIQLKTETVFILKAFRQALIQANFISYDEETETVTIQEGNNFDARLIPSIPKTRGGIGNNLLRSGERIFDTHLGAQVTTLPLMEIITESTLTDRYQTTIPDADRCLHGF